MFVNRQPATPTSWLSPEMRHKVESLDRLSGAERQSVAAALADRLARDSVPAIAYGFNVQGEFFASTVGCCIFPPLSFGVDLAALCRNGDG
jgi:hypothetical protein